MNYDLINVTVYRFMDRYVAQVSWRHAEDDTTPFWGGSRSVDLQVELGDLEDILTSLAEELYNVAPHVGRPATRTESPATPRGGSNSLPPWRDKQDDGRWRAGRSGL